MCNQSFILSEFTNDKIFNAVCKVQGKEKLMVEELGMSDLFRKHSMWGADIRIMGIDGGAENESACDTDDNDFDNDSDEEDDDNETNIEPTESQNIESFLVQEACTDDATQIADDLKSIFKHDLVDSTIRETLEQQQCFLYKRLPSSTIPIYKQVDECFKAENATVTSQKKWIARNSINLLKLKQTITKPFSFVKPQLFGYFKRVSLFPLIV